MSTVRRTSTLAVMYEYLYSIDMVYGMSNRSTKCVSTRLGYDLLLLTTNTMSTSTGYWYQI